MQSNQHVFDLNVRDYPSECNKLVIVNINEYLNCNSPIADHVKTTGHNIKWDRFDILASGKTDYHCKVKETLFIQELKPALALNANVSSEKLFSLCPITDSFRLKRVKFLLQMSSF